MINRSKANDPRFWKKWRESGAVGTIETAIKRSQGNGYDTINVPVQKPLTEISLILDKTPEGYEPEVNFKFQCITFPDSSVHPQSHTVLAYVDRLSHYVAGALGQRGGWQFQFLDLFVNQAYQQLAKQVPEARGNIEVLAKSKFRDLVYERNLEIKSKFSENREQNNYR